MPCGTPSFLRPVERAAGNSRLDPAPRHGYERAFAIRAISSVVERLVYTEDVGSSTLSSPTIPDIKGSNAAPAEQAAPPERVSRVRQKMSGVRPSHRPPFSTNSQLRLCGDTANTGLPRVGLQKRQHRLAACCPGKGPAPPEPVSRNRQREPAENPPCASTHAPRPIRAALNGSRWLGLTIPPANDPADCLRLLV